MTKIMTILSQNIFFHMIFTFILPCEQNSKISKNIFYQFCEDSDKMSHRQTDRYFIDRKKVNPDLFVIEIREISVHIYKIVNLLKSYDNIHSMTYITKIMLTGIAIKTLGITIT